jgi:inorganic phosphate transporter, PiT family
MSVSLAVLTVAGAAVLAFANGANDVSKGVATLAGAGRTSYRRAIAWGTLWTCVGAVASLVISVGLVKAFTSSIVAPDVLGLPTFPFAVAAGAAGWVLFASATGLPVSTTHALTGAIVGMALMAAGPGSIRWPVLLSGIAAPLALSPLLAGGIGFGMHAIARRMGQACVCIEHCAQPEAVGPDGTMTSLGSPYTRVMACRAADHLGVSGGTPSDAHRLLPGAALHWGAAAALSFARGVNDNAKLAAIATLGFTAMGAPLAAAFAVTAAAMTVGSYAAGLRVTRTLGERVVHMDQDTGLAAALTSAGLVLAASFHALPVSTTHVSTGAIVGSGIRQGRHAVEWRRVGGLVSAWLVTLPIAAALAALTGWLMA